MRPKLPPTERIAPYLKTIDSSRTYSNFGPLAVSLEERLAAHFSVRREMITTTANATLGLTLALTALAPEPRTLCVMPAWTFVASAHAAISAGLVPYFVDVDPQTWALNPDAMDDVIAGAPAPVGAIMPVAPFGRPIDAAAWDRYTARTGRPVVIDAAAGFDSVIPSRTPSVVSLHATKVLGIGEGGFVLSTDEALVRGVRARSNFGFFGARTSIAASTNAKLSEYQAAVGHASLDEWTEAQGEWNAVAARYRSVLPESNFIQYQAGFGTDWVSSTCILRLPGSDAVEVARALANADIETRRWWGDGAHLHPSTTEFPRLPLPTTEALSRTTLSVPFHRDLDTAQIQKVADAIQAAVAT